MVHQQAIIELEGFPVIQGREAVAHEWMNFLQDHQAAVIETLPAEHMRVESLFSTTINGRLYLFWYSLQSAKGADVSTSTSWVDQQHVAYWRQCIDEGRPSLKMKLENHFESTIDH